MKLVTAAVEGPTDEAVARRLLQTVGLNLGPVYGKQGKPALDLRLRGYNEAARLGAWLVLRDLDTDADCAAALRLRLLPYPAPGMLLRIPVRAVEAWLLADHEAMADFLGVPKERIPSNPESFERPKRTLVDLARRSRRRDILRDLVPDQGLSSEVGRAYSARLVDFVRNRWDPERASIRSDSLARCLRALRALAGET